MASPPGLGSPAYRLLTLPVDASLAGTTPA